MSQRVLLNLMLLVLFAMTQTGIAMHEVSHIDPEYVHTQSDKQDSNTAEEHCDHCLAQADADNANTPASLRLPIASDQLLLATIPVATLVSRLPKLYSPRAPPAV